MVPILTLLAFPFDTMSSFLSLSLCFFDSCWLLLYVLVVVVLITAVVVGCSFEKWQKGGTFAGFFGLMVESKELSMFWLCFWGFGGWGACCVCSFSLM